MPKMHKPRTKSWREVFSIAQSGRAKKMKKILALSIDYTFAKMQETNILTMFACKGSACICQFGIEMQILHSSATYSL
jgi:hypothetical protein